jgi:hypothetical protein
VQGHSIQGPSLLYQGHAKFTALASHEGALDSGPSFLHQGHAKFTALSSSEAFNSGPLPSLPGACKIHCPFLLRGIQFRAPPFFTRGMQNSLPFPPQRHSIQGSSLLFQGHDFLCPFTFRGLYFRLIKKYRIIRNLGELFLVYWPKC